MDLEDLRLELDKNMNELLHALFKRTELVKLIGEYKKANNLEVYDPAREEKVLQSWLEKGSELGLSEQLIREVFQSVVADSKRTQNQLVGN